MYGIIAKDSLNRIYYLYAHAESVSSETSYRWCSDADTSLTCTIFHDKDTAQYYLQNRRAEFLSASNADTIDPSSIGVAKISLKVRFCK